MAIVNNREKVLFLPLVRSFFNKELGRRAKKQMVDAASELGITGILPADDSYTDGSICSDDDVRAYFEVWRAEMSDIKAKVGKSTLDESSGAYKDIHMVMANQEELVDVVAHIVPLINIKA